MSLWNMFRTVCYCPQALGWQGKGPDLTMKEKAGWKKRIFGSLALIRPDTFHSLAKQFAVCPFTTSVVGFFRLPRLQLEFISDLVNHRTPEVLSERSRVWCWWCALAWNALLSIPLVLIPKQTTRRLSTMYKRTSKPLQKELSVATYLLKDN